VGASVLVKEGLRLDGWGGIYCGVVRPLSEFT
jgi:hypothetical protein